MMNIRVCSRLIISDIAAVMGFLISSLAMPAVAIGGPDAGPAKTTGPAHANVENRVAESSLTTVTLTPEAIERLAIKTVPVREGSRAHRRLFGGETMVPSGRTIQLAAPFTGTIVEPEGKTAPGPGALVKKGDAILRLLPVVMADREVLTPSERISLARAMADFEAAQAQAEGEVTGARVQLDTAQLRLERAQKLRKENATSEKLLDEAKAEFELSKARLEAAQSKSTAWKQAAQGMQAERQISLVLTAPFDGMLLDLSVAPGEVVNAAAPVARFIGVDPLWIRVPVYVGALAELDVEKDVRIGGMDGRLKPDMQSVDRVEGAPTADPISSSVDLYFSLPNPGHLHRPQQRLGVWISQRGQQSGLIIPWSALLYDIHGNTWVYEQTQPRQFVRRRVEVRDTLGGDAMLSRGLRAGMNVVTDGAAELFGVEFGAGK